MAAEKQLDEKLKRFLKDSGAWFIKYWGGGNFTKKGIPDILACLDGDFFGIEDKAPDGKPTLLQIVNLEKIRKAGGYGILLYPKDFEQFKQFTRQRSRDTPWYLANIEQQKQWKIKLQESEE